MFFGLLKLSVLRHDELDKTSYLMIYLKAPILIVVVIMPFGLPTNRYAVIVFSGFGSASLGSLCVHLQLRPDRSAPNMSPYIEAQRDLIRKVQNRKTEQQAPSIVVDSSRTDTNNPVIKTLRGEFRSDELDAMTGLPKSMGASAPSISKSMPRFWMYIPIAQEAVQDLVEGPLIQLPNQKSTDPPSQL